MLSHTKKNLTLTETIFDPFLESLLQCIITYNISQLSIILLTRIKAYQTLNNTFISGYQVKELFTHNISAYRIYLVELKNKGFIEYVNTGTEALNGYNVTPKGERALAYLTSLYNKQTKHNIQAHQDTRLSTKPFKDDQFNKYFSKVKNPNTQLKGKQLDHLQPNKPKKGEIIAKRAQRAKEAEAEQLEELNNIRADKQKDQDQPQKKSSNPFKL